MPGTYNRKDHYYDRAKEEGFASRAVYKLQQLDQRFKLFKPGQSLLDLGCAPGSWLQWISGRIGEKGHIIGIDLLPTAIKAPANAEILLGDFTEELVLEKISDCLKSFFVNSNPKWGSRGEVPGGVWAKPTLEESRVDLVVSDSSPNLSGILFADQERSLELNRAVIGVAIRFLKPKGKLLLKSFEGESIPELKKALQTHFTQITRYIPDATRKTSREVYWVAERK